MSWVWLPVLAAFRPLFHPLQDRLLGALQLVARRAQRDGARQRAVVAVEDAGDLEERRFAGDHPAVVPGEVRRCGVRAGGEQRHDGRIAATAADGLVVAQRCVVDVGHEIALAQPRLHDLEDALVHALHDACRDAHVSQLLRALDRALPVHEAGGVLELCVRQLLHQRGEGAGGEPVVVHLHADAARRQPASGEVGGQHLHRMAHLGLHVVVRVADDIVGAHEDGAVGALRVLLAAEPERIARQPQHHALVDVERPAVIAGQPGHVGGVRDDDRLDAGPLHGGARFGDPRSELGMLELEPRDDGGGVLERGHGIRFR